MLDSHLGSARTDREGVGEVQANLSLAQHGFNNRKIGSVVLTLPNRVVCMMTDRREAKHTICVIAV